MHTHVNTCFVHDKDRTHTHKNQPPPPLLSPRATRAESTKRHVESIVEKRGGEKQEEEEERIKEQRDRNKKTSQRERDRCSIKQLV